MCRTVTWLVGLDVVFGTLAATIASSREPAPHRKSRKVDGTAMRRSFGSIALGALCLVLLSGFNSQDFCTLASFAQRSPFTPKPGCSRNVVPTGQANPSCEPEPMDPIWCFNL